jgi:hypothetical protein
MTGQTGAHTNRPELVAVHGVTTAGRCHTLAICGRRQFRPQRRHRPGDVAPDSTFADPGSRSDLGLRQVSEVPQHQNLALPGGKSPQRGNEGGTFGRGARLLTGARHVRRGLGCLRALDHVVPR